MLYWSLRLDLVVAGDEVIRASAAGFVNFLWIDFKFVDDFLCFFFGWCSALDEMYCANVLALRDLLYIV